MTLAPAFPGRGADRPSTQMADFRVRCEAVAGVPLDDPGALHAFSVEQPEAFWRTFLSWAELPWSGSADVVLTGDDVETARFFPDVRLNYAEALLRPLPGADDDGLALTSVHAGRPAERWTRAELRAEVQRTSAALAGIGLCPGDRVVLVAPNSGRNAIVALAAAALGAPVATAPPDMGAAALLGRFEQVDPVLLVLDRTGMAEETLGRMLAGLPTLHRLLILDDLPLPTVSLPVDRLDELPGTAEDCPAWERRPFDAPLFVMFSSGTSGPPKAMVHGIGGTLLEHLKEHRLHNDVRPADVYYHHSTTAWMVWNRHLSTLATGAHIVVYDGPVAGPETLWELVADHGVTVLGTSPAYLQLCEDAGYRPADVVDLSRLRTVLSSGAILHDWQYAWVADAVGPVPLQSISGGTDIIGAFVLGSPEVPVRPGRIQARSLGMDVAAVDDEGREVIGQVGELVCRNPFPSRPVGFLRDPDGRRFHEAYFVQHPGMWTHGDLVDFDVDGSARLHGRSDGVLNIDGLRIGPSEIYAVLRRLPDIADAAAVEQRDPGRPGSGRMVLLVVLRPGVRLDGGLERTIRRTLRQEASAAHVPSLVVAVPELPVTHNGKRSDRAARDAVNGDPVANADALRNPGCLDAIRAAVAQVTAPPASGPVPADGGDPDVPGGARRIWCETLGTAQTDPDADFADLGGTSRQLLSLLRRVRLELGADVPLREFARRPTLRGLSEAVAGALAAADGRPADPVSVLRPGVGRPVFLVPDAWGQLNLYAGLVDRLETERPVLGLHLALTDAGGRHRAVPDVAVDAVAQIRQAQPDGPYALIGYSFGGMVAYAAATALVAAGLALDLVGLIDVVPPAAALTGLELRTRGWIQRLQRLRRRARGTSVDTAGPAAATGTEELFFAGSHEVASAFRPEPYDGTVSYYLAARRLPIVGNSLSAWRRVAPHLAVTEVPGRHMDTDDSGDGVLGRQHVATLAAHISADLRAAER
jgi:acetoacetyl-CoA synthetase